MDVYFEVESTVKTQIRMHRANTLRWEENDGLLVYTIMYA